MGCHWDAVGVPWSPFLIVHFLESKSIVSTVAAVRLFFWSNTGCPFYFSHFPLYLAALMICTATSASLEGKRGEKSAWQCFPPRHFPSIPMWNIDSKHTGRHSKVVQHHAGSGGGITNLACKLFAKALSTTITQTYWVSRSNAERRYSMAFADMPMQTSLYVHTRSNIRTHTEQHNHVPRVPPRCMKRGMAHGGASLDFW